MKKTILAISASLALAGCAADDPHKRAKTGAAIGAIAGAVLGHQVHDSRGRYVGAVGGALAGAAVGNYMDKQQAELERKLAEERRQHEIEIQRLNDETLKLNLSSEVTFDVNSDRIKPDFKNSLNKLSNVLSDYDKTVVHVIGHTDSTGAASYNQSLSERRAQAVKTYLASHHVSSERVRTEGRGENEPIASNATSDGRQMNRRVEIYLKPVKEGAEAQAFESPRY